MTRTTKKVLVVAITPLLAFSLAACGASAASTTTGSSTTSSPVAAATTSASAAQQTSAATSSAAAATVTPTTESATSTASATESSTTTSTSAASSTTKLNLNEVTEAELLNTIPNFSSRMVREFMEYRPYVSIAQFRQEIGKYVDAAQVAQYEQYVYVPVDVNASDAATLQQLPGVDATIAAQLIAGRSYASNDAFLAKLAQYVSSADVQAARAYLATN